MILAGLGLATLGFGARFVMRTIPSLGKKMADTVYNAPKLDSKVSCLLVLWRGGHTANRIFVMMLVVVYLQDLCFIIQFFLMLISLSVALLKYFPLFSKYFTVACTVLYMYMDVMLIIG